VILHLTARSQKRRTVERFIEALRQIEGAYALACLTDNMLIGARDPVGIRPLVLGRLGSAYVLASETCALDIVGATFEREIDNGEVVVISDNGLEVHRPFPRRPARPCIFEQIYFARPDSIVGGRTVYSVRKQMGAELAREAGVACDVIVPIPDSGVPAAIGYSQASGIPFELGIIRNHYVGRTFIEPEQRIRALGVKLKHSANRSVIAGKRLVLIDDSVVRGTTSKKIVELMYEAGAKEVHMRIACPPIMYPDFYGIDTPDKLQLLAAKTDVEGMRAFMGATSLAFLSVDGVYRSCGYAARDAKNPQYSDHCFTGEYPTALTDQTGDIPSRELALAVEA
jgi:amidophosphoribosyltransferase